ncbi:hypothetical protein LSP04_12810 [Levilactobacillus spicheri]|uniref:Uncharacterized protein n=1 Tax=Levilactobacillus spicheri TaxID=216463 RepID=A0ABQ0WP35_9LACO|nr:hypothetical protein LSP04_12810 [Levilactobacillus spicheri]
MFKMVPSNQEKCVSVGTRDFLWIDSHGDAGNHFRECRCGTGVPDWFADIAGVRPV